MKYKNKPMLSCAKLCTTFGSYYQVCGRVSMVLAYYDNVDVD